MARPLPRYLDVGAEGVAFEARLARILLEVGEPAPDPKLYAATAGGDGRRLRGPAHAKGTGGGAIAGTDPLRALLAKERRHGRGRS